MEPSRRTTIGTGRTENNRVVNFRGSPRLLGEFVDVTITAALPHSLRGEIVATFH
jgi:tRNA-2-methylthio-N6-dimethylallyladenosine synthase